MQIHNPAVDEKEGGGVDKSHTSYVIVFSQDGEVRVRTHHVEYADGGILDPDDMLTDLVEDRDKVSPRGRHLLSFPVWWAFNSAFLLLIC